MFLHGYCTGCRKIKRVRVTGANLAFVTTGIPQGICASCEDEQAKR